MSISEFIGHFHPLLVHLPIGILLLALLLQWLSRKEKYSQLQAAVPITLLAGSVSALASCITGYLSSISDDYDKDLVSWHMWMGIGVALIALLLYAKEKNKSLQVNKPVLSVSLLILVGITGHLGGSLTHGSDYLTKPLKNLSVNDSASAAIKPIANVQEAVVYTDIIQPILQIKCYSCHGANKQKGKLRLDNPEAIMKGGEDGKVIVAGNVKETELIIRLLLGRDNDDHMPPKEKPQPSEKDISLLKWWVSTGASFTAKTKELQQPTELKPLLLSLQKPVIEKKELVAIPATPVDAADEKVIATLRKQNIVVIPVAQNSHYLSASFVTDSIINDADIEQLLLLKRQLVWLNLSNTNCIDTTLSKIASLTALTKLNLLHTKITDKGLPYLQTLTQLKHLNLVANDVTIQGIQSLNKLQGLASIYLYQTKIKTGEWVVLNKMFPLTDIDSGGYKVQTLYSDTTEVKYKPAP